MAERRYLQCVSDYSDSIERVRELRARCREATGQPTGPKRRKTTAAPADTAGAALSQTPPAALPSAAVPPPYPYPPPYATPGVEYAYPAAAATGSYPPYYAYPPSYFHQQAFTAAYPYTG